MVYIFILQKTVAEEGPLQRVADPGKFVTEELREGGGKSKWKFKMAFAMKGGGSRGGLKCHIPILKK